MNKTPQKFIVLPNIQILGISHGPYIHPGPLTFKKLIKLGAFAHNNSAFLQHGSGLFDSPPAWYGFASRICVTCPVRGQPWFTFILRLGIEVQLEEADAKERGGRGLKF